MSFLYERKENSKEITIKYTYWGLYYPILFLFLILVFVFQGVYSILILAVFIGLALVFTVGFWKPNMEIKRAMKKGKVKVSGSKFSIRKPLTAVIEK